MEKAINNSLTQELEAMAAIGQVLSELIDVSARQRVLKWAAERFSAEMAAAGTPTPEPVASPDGDAAFLLALDSLDDIFPVEPEQMDSDFAPFDTCDAETAKLPLEAVLRSFAADFQRFAEEWNGAAA